MRSDLIFGALTHVNNRYQLCQLASKATRKLHKPNTRLQDTMNDVLVRFRDASPVAATAPATRQTVAISQQHRRAA
ncbi:MAG: DNA-directed RNA polymerase subunit omega [Acidobacteriaceae bacterium]